MITVMKFGGTSVGSVEAFNRVADIIINEKGKKIIVISAMSGITDFLVSVIENNNVAMDDAIKIFRDKHLNIARCLLPKKFYDEFLDDFEVRFSQFENVMFSDEEKKDPYYNDNVLSQGERFSSLILSYLIKSKGHESVALTSEMAGIYAIGKTMSGLCDFKKTEVGLNTSVVPLLKSNVIPIITGFYGINKDGRPLTFGRGGSDYTASAIGNAVNANSIQIWTDVDGFMSADPRLVKNAVTLAEMSFDEAAELTHFGAKVLHPMAIEPAKLKCIPLWIKNSYRPENPGTLIHCINEERYEPIRSVATKLDLSILTLTIKEMLHKPMFFAKVLEKLSEADICIYGVSTSLFSIALLVRNIDLERCLTLLNVSSDKSIEKINVKNNMTLICTVGDNLLNRCEFCGDIFDAIKNAGTNVEMISKGASNVTLNFVVSADYATKIIKTIHEKFISKGALV